ncbi:MAG: hypothetical protein ACRDNO_15595 [Trebonia sp.]
MNEHDVMCQVRESFSVLRMDVPVETVFARSRVRRRRRLSGLTAAVAATAGAAAALVLIPGGPAPAHAVNPPPSHGPVKLTAFSVTSGPGGSTTLTMRKGARFDPSALRHALARHGIPALVTVGSFCRSTPGSPASIGQVLRASTLADGSDVLVINGQAIRLGTRLSIGYFPGRIQMALVKDGARLSCSSTSHQPAVHLTPSGTPIRR